MKRFVAAIASLLALACVSTSCSIALAAQQWVTSATTSASYSVPLGTACDPLEVERDGNGGSRHYAIVPTHPGVRVPFRCKLVTVADPVPAPTSAPTTTPIPSPAPSSSWSGALYTDIVNGPANSYLTIYGGGLGASGTVTIGGIAANVLRWTDTQVTVQPTSSGPIALNGKETALSFSLVPGKVTLITAGADIQPCIDAANPGDHCVIRGGTYSPLYAMYGSFFSIHHKGGTAQAAIVVMGYPGETVLFARTVQTRGIHTWATPGHFVIANLHVDGKRSTAGTIGLTPGTVDVRLVNNDVTGFYEDSGGAAAIDGSGKQYRIFGNQVHDNTGSKLYHALYFDSRDTTGVDDIEIAYNHIHHQGGGRGIQIYGDTGTPITNVKIHHNHIHHIALNGILLARDTAGGHEVHDNLVHDTSDPTMRVAADSTDQGSSGSCLRFANSATQAKVYNNTFANCDLDASPDSGAINIDAANNVGLSNNIVVSKKYLNGIVPAGSVVTSNDWFGAGAPPSADTAPLNVDPQFDANFKPANPAVIGKGAF